METHSVLSFRTKMKPQRSLFLSLSALALLSQNLLLPVAAAGSKALDNQKNYYYSPPPPHGGHPPPSPSTPGGGGSCSPAPPSPGGGYHHSPPSTPTHHVPPPSPTTPVKPSPPVPAVKPSPPVPVKPPPPVPVHPGFGPFPCTYWGSHPRMIFGVLGWWGTVGVVFGVAALPGVDPSSFTLQHALTNTRPDGYGALYRHAAASFLNSLAVPYKFPFTTTHVRSAFASALSSDKAAASQARLFRLANEGRLKLV